MKGHLILMFVFLSLSWLTLKRIPFLAFLFSTAFLIGIGVWDRLWLYFGRRVVSEDLKDKIRSKNILAHLPGDSEGRPFYLVAHDDSKSQSLNLYLRTIFSWLIALQGVSSASGSGSIS